MLRRAVRAGNSSPLQRYSDGDGRQVHMMFGAVEHITRNPQARQLDGFGMPELSAALVVRAGGLRDAARRGDVGRRRHSRSRARAHPRASPTAFTGRAGWLSGPPAGVAIVLTAVGLAGTGRAKNPGNVFGKVIRYRRGRAAGPEIALRIDP